MSEEIKYKWMPHLEDAVPTAGQGKRISTYTVSLEGWRRGLQLSFYSIFEDGNKLKVRYSLSNGEKTHDFQLSMGDRVSQQAFEICNDKDLTKQYLGKQNVPIPHGKMFDKKVPMEEIVQYALSLGFPLVVKPTDGNAGKGVFANIQSESDLRDIIPHVREELGFNEIIIENYVAGEEFRIYAIEDKILGAMNRRPANVRGDGVSTIRQLIHTKNEIRKINPHLTSRLIKVDKEIERVLEESGYTLNAIPREGELVFLREKSNLSTGGDAVNVTDQLTPELRQITIDAGKAIPGLTHFGVDMIVSDDRKKGVILEVNSRPGLGGHMFPGEGEPLDFAKDIIDYYFPETIDIERSPLYYDFDNVILPIKSRAASNVDLIKPPLGKMYGKKLTISGNYNRRMLRKEIYKQARLLDVHGRIEELEDNQVQIIVMGLDEGVINNFKQICHDSVSDIDGEIDNIIEETWNKPLQIGFHIVNKKYTNVEVNQIIQDQERLERENLQITKRYNDITRSKAWKATLPVRFVLQKIKHMLRR